MTSDEPDLRTPPSIRAQLLATEHWSLLATRSMTWSDVHGRISIHLTVTSVSLVAVALAVQATGFGPEARVLAIGVSAAVLLLGTLTGIRVMNASNDDFALIIGMNRLRAAYRELDPGIEEYFVTGWRDDAAGVAETYAMTQRRGASQLIGSTAFFLLAVNAIVAGVLAALVTSAAGGSTASTVVVGTSGALLYLGALLIPGAVQYRRWMREYRPRHADPSPADAPVTDAAGSPAAPVRASRRRTDRRDGLSR